MDRWACVDLYALPLQLLMRDHADWAGHPVVVVDEDKPQGKILWANRQAHRCCVRTGMRYAEALSLVGPATTDVDIARAKRSMVAKSMVAKDRGATQERSSSRNTSAAGRTFDGEHPRNARPDAALHHLTDSGSGSRGPTDSPIARTAGLRAGVVSPVRIEAAIQEVAQRLQRFTPEIEPCRWPGEHGVFWLNASGLDRLVTSLRDWAATMEAELFEAKLQATVVVGFDRFNTFALARHAAFVDGKPTKGHNPRVQFLATRATERKRTDAVPLAHLNLAPRLRDDLERVSVLDVGTLRALPAGGIMERFGRESFQMHRLMHGELAAPLEPIVDTPQIERRFDAEPEQQEIDQQSLLFLIKQAIGRMHDELHERGEVFAALQLQFDFEKLPSLDMRIEPAKPTRDAVQLVNLVQLRLEREPFPAAVIGLAVRAEGLRPDLLQKELFAEEPKRDLDAASRALARLRARFGNDAVQCAVLQPGHLPEARFRWQPLTRLPHAKPTAPVVEQWASPGVGYDAGSSTGHSVRLAAEPPSPRLVRRILQRPSPLTSHRDPTDGWFLGNFEGGPVAQTWGPFVVSGGWWRRLQHRDYYFVQLRRGDLLWVYHDRLRRRWFLQGTVE